MNEAKFTMDDLKRLLLESTVPGIGFQFASILLVTLALIYWITSMRDEGVVILSHPRILLESALVSAMNVGFYQGVLWLGPGKTWHWVLAIIGTLPMKIVTYNLLRPIDRNRSLRDTERDEDALFNCNWPLIPRCSNQALFMLLLGAMALWSRH